MLRILFTLALFMVGPAHAQEIESHQKVGVFKFVTLFANFCHSAVDGGVIRCEHVFIVDNTSLPGFNELACQIFGQHAILDYLSNHPGYRIEYLQKYQCVIGNYPPEKTA